MPRTELTQKQKRVLDYIVMYIRRKKHGPFQTEIQRAMHLRTPTEARRICCILWKRGYIDWRHGEPGTIRLVPWNKRGKAI